MARGTMTPSKPEGQRRRRNQPTHGDQVVTPDAVVRGPELIGSYEPETIEWYMTWRTSPQAQLFEDTDWQRLLMLAKIVDAYMKRPSAAALGEIRMSEERLGATVVDRMRARIKIDRAPDNDTPAEVVPIATARRKAAQSRLSGDKKE